jgi:enoyl-CoA hydratase/carnithine racemase
LLGLVSRVVPDGPGSAQAGALEVAEEICKYSRSVIGLGKAFFYTQIEQNIHTANRFKFFKYFQKKYQKLHRQGAAMMCENLKLADAEEGIRAFLEKRQSKWTKQQ